MAGARKPAAQTGTQLPHAPTSAALARRFVAAALHNLGLDALVEVVALLTGELVANAIVHTPASPVGVVVGWGDQAVRVEVHDASPQLPRLNRPAAPEDEAGRGLGLVAALATRWGVEVDAAQAVAWAQGVLCEWREAPGAAGHRRRATLDPAQVHVWLAAQSSLSLAAGAARR